MEPRFDFNSMLMFGWVAKADPSFTVCEVNDSLRAWMQDPSRSAALDRLGSIPLAAFIDALLESRSGAPDFSVGGLLVASLNKLIGPQVLQAAPLEPQQEEWHDSGIELLSTCRPVQRHAVGGRPGMLAAVRMVSAEGFRLRSPLFEERVDIIAVCTLVPVDEGKWQLVSIQGQLQEAWLRVKPVIQYGTRSGAVSLMSRNMSHNLGSHALFYLQHAENVDDRKKLFGMLRERMELIANFATGTSLSPVEFELGELVEDFNQQRLILDNIVQSEDVKRVSVVTSPKPLNTTVALPGGAYGAQAFYSILENIIRDSAKHADAMSESGKRAITIVVRAMDAEGPASADLVRVEISDDRRMRPGALEKLRNCLDTLRVADDAGRLVREHWGVKERWVAAALLRGFNAGDVPLERDHGVIDATLGTFAPSNEPRFVAVRGEGNRLVWVIHLLKPKTVLVVGGDASVVKREAGIDYVSFDDLETRARRGAGLRHRFVVLWPQNEDDRSRAMQLLPRLPGRVFVRGHEGSGSGFVAPLQDAEVGSGLSLTDLEVLWVERLAERNPSAPRAIVATGPVIGNDEVVFARRGMSVRQCADNALDQWAKDAIEKSAIIEHHSARLEKLVTHRCVGHYEFHHDGDPVQETDGWSAIRRLTTDAQRVAYMCRVLEAAMLRICVMDERIDALVDERKHKRGSLGDAKPYREVFRWKGVEVRGREFSSAQKFGPDDVIAPVAGKNFHFLVVHASILDKACKRVIPEMPLADLCVRLQAHVTKLVVHSGRAAPFELPRGVGNTGLSNVQRWFDENAAKTQIVEELYAVR